MYMPFGGIKIIESVALVDRTRAKTHRKKRIDKKWLKRYGFITSPSKKTYIMNDTLFCHPVTARVIRNHINQTDKTSDACLAYHW